jgi:AbiV family abortive infection protein
MKAQSSHSRRTSKSEPVIIPVAIVREGCTKIAENILELSDHANRFIDLNEEIVTRRIAYILVIHAMDEAGKLLEIMRKMVVADSTGASTITVEGFYSHRLKGSEAGTIGLLTIDWLDKIVEALALKTEKPIPPPFKEYRAHLEHLRQDFPREREHALYVDLEEGIWMPPRSPEESDIAFDAYLLGMLALFAQLGISAGRSFTELSDLGRQVSSMSVEELNRRFRSETDNRA